MKKKMFLALLILGFLSLGAWGQTWVTQDAWYGIQWSVLPEEHFNNYMEWLRTNEAFVVVAYSKVPEGIHGIVIDGSRPEFSGFYYLHGTRSFPMPLDVVEFGDSNIGAVSIDQVYEPSPGVLSLPYQWNEFISQIEQSFQALRGQ